MFILGSAGWIRPLRILGSACGFQVSWSLFELVFSFLIISHWTVKQSLNRKACYLKEVNKTRESLLPLVFQTWKEILFCTVFPVEVLLTLALAVFWGSSLLGLAEGAEENRRGAHFSFCCVSLFDGPSLEQRFDMPTQCAFGRALLLLWDPSHKCH